MSEPTTFLQTCSMKHNEITRVSQMIESHAEFSAIGITVNSDRKTHDPSLAMQIPEGYVLVTFAIPEGVCMPDFYGAFYRALNQESPMMPQGERKK